MMKRSLLVVYAVLFGAYMGISLPLPLMGPMILSDTSPFNLATEGRYFYLSLVLASFPLGNLLGAPFLGSLSDRFGRKKILLNTLMGSAIFYVLSGVAIAFGNIVLLVISRFLSGMFEGNAAIAQSFIAQNVDAKNKPKMFGIMISVMSVGYVLGPLVGGVFTNSKIVPFASSALPFYVVAFFVLLTICAVKIFFESDKSDRVVSAGFVIGMRELFNLKFFINLILLTFIYAIARSLYIDYLASFLNLRFGVESDQTTWIWILLAAIWGVAALGTEIGKEVMSHKVKVVIATLLAGVLTMIISMSQSLMSFAILSSLLVVFLALVGTINAVVISDAASKVHMGLAMGLLSSMYLSGEVTACLLGGPLLKLRENIPFLVSGVILCIVSLGFMRVFFCRPVLRENVVD